MQGAVFSYGTADNSFLVNCHELTKFSAVSYLILGQTAGSGLFSVMFLFSGFFVLRDEIPDYWIWLHYLSLFKYGYDSMVVNAFKHYVHSDSLTNEEILHMYSVDGVDRGTGIGVLWLFTIAFRCVFYYRLVTRFSGSRK